MVGASNVAPGDDRFWAHLIAVFNTLCWQTPMLAVPQVHASFEVVTTYYNSLMTIARKNGNTK